METYLLKSTAILSIFWLLYILLLERENMHRFKRFYLLSSVILAIGIPLLKFKEVIYITPSELANNELSSFPIPDFEIIITPFWTLKTILWSFYGIGVLVFGIRFIKNLSQIIRVIKQNEKFKQTPITFVLLQQFVTPHTFFNYIFLNKLKFKNSDFPKEVILHEETHAKQKHSLDVLFIEVLQVIFWFQPFIWLYKKHIKLNHEFLADQAVLNQGYQPANYQNTLLSFSSNHQDYSLVNAINYSSIKKRFTVMKTQTPQTKKWILSLLILPVLAVLTYSFSNKEVIEKELYNQNNADSIQNTKEELDNAKNPKLKRYNTAMKIYSDAISDYLNGSQTINSELKILKAQTDAIYKTFSNEDIKRHKLKAAAPIPVKNLKQQKPPTAKEVAAYNTWVKKIKKDTFKAQTDERNGKQANYPIIKQKDLVRFVDIYNRMTTEQKAKSETLPLLDKDLKNTGLKFPPPPPPQQKPPTEKEIAAYNTWAKKVTTQIEKAKENNSNEYPTIKLKDIKRHTSVYGRMTEHQKAKAEKFPNIPPPPPPAPKAPPAPPKKEKIESKKTKN